MHTSIIRRKYLINGIKRIVQINYDRAKHDHLTHFSSGGEEEAGVGPRVGGGGGGGKGRGAERYN